MFIPFAIVCNSCLQLPRYAPLLKNIPTAAGLMHNVFAFEGLPGGTWQIKTLSFSLPQCKSFSPQRTSTTFTYFSAVIVQPRTSVTVTNHLPAAAGVTITYEEE